MDINTTTNSETKNDSSETVGNVLRKKREVIGLSSQRWLGTLV